MNAPAPLRRSLHEMTDRDIAIETLERSRRVETRLTKFLQTQGFDTQGTRAQYADQVVSLPSKDITVRELLTCIPPDMRGKMIKVYVGDDMIAAVYPFDNGLR